MPADVLRSKLYSLVSDALPPENPVVAADLGAIAFERNRYEDLAPTDVWEAWFTAHRSACGPSALVGIVSARELLSGGEGVKIEAGLPSVRTYLFEEGRFLQDHFLFSPAMDWLIRLDQDVTLFAANVDFLQVVVADLHGLDGLMRRMVDDFDPGEDDPVGLLRFLSAITSGLR